MADDLSQFFAKKSAKVKEKKKKVKLSVDKVGQVLERKAKRQEERDREDEEDERRAQDNAAFFEKRPEDSEWLEYKDTKKEIVLEELGIRDMNLTEQVEEELEDEKATTTEAPKTWSVAEKKESEEVAVPAPKPKPGIWKPRMMQNLAVKAGVVPNINDQDMFPTFEAAEKIELSKKTDEKKRKNDGFTTVTSQRETLATYSSRINRERPTMDRAELFSAVKQVTSAGAPNPVAPTQAAPKSNIYVPPALRRAQAAAGAFGEAR